MLSALLPLDVWFSGSLGMMKKYDEKEKKKGFFFLIREFAFCDNKESDNLLRCLPT